MKQKQFRNFLRLKNDNNSFFGILCQPVEEPFDIFIDKDICENARYLFKFSRRKS